MKSIAIWYNPKSPITDKNAALKNVHLHFNLWKLPNNSHTFIRFLDIGIRIDAPSDVKEIKLYFPEKMDEDNLYDIVDKFINKPALVSAIFNENYKVGASAISKATSIHDSKDKFVFNIYKTEKSDRRKEEAFLGSVFTISVPETEQPIYFRFRVKGKFLEALSSTHTPTNAILESAFSEIEMIDFRVNEIRDLNLTLLENIEREAKFKIKKQHFFFICSNEEDVTGFHEPFLSCRNLENYRWNDYVDLPDHSSQMFLAYHWKDEDVDNTNILIKTKYEKNNWETIVKYGGFALLIALTVELLGNGLYDFITWLGKIIFGWLSTIDFSKDDKQSAFLLFIYIPDFVKKFFKNYL